MIDEPGHRGWCRDLGDLLPAVLVVARLADEVGKAAFGLVCCMSGWQL
jgi:hypothetical protein